MFGNLESHEERYICVSLFWLLCYRTVKVEELIKGRKCTSKTFFSCFLGEEWLIIVQVAILLNIWLLQTSVFFFFFLHVILERIGLQMIFIKNSPTHLLLSLTTYVRDISEDMMKECVGESVIILS